MSVNSLATFKKIYLYSSIFFYILYIYISIFFYILYSCFFTPSTRETCLFSFFCGSVFSPMQKKDCTILFISKYTLFPNFLALVFLYLVCAGDNWKDTYFLKEATSMTFWNFLCNVNFVLSFLFLFPFYGQI